MTELHRASKSSMMSRIRMKKQWALACSVAALFAFQSPLLCRSDTVGAYYYPWYGTFSGGHSWTQTLRQQLAPAQPPAIGYYNSRDSATIEGQIDESRRGNISFWATSWWGPGSTEDTTIRTRIFTDPRAGELKYAVHYESTGRLGSFDNPTYSNLLPDFQYLA